MTDPDVSAEACRERLRRKSTSEKLTSAGDRMQKTGRGISKAGSEIIWVVVAFLLLILVGIPALIAAFS